MKESKPKTGTKVDSSLTSMLKKLSKDKPTEQMPQLPEPLFDKEMGGLFKKKKKKA